MIDDDEMIKELNFNGEESKEIRNIVQSKNIEKSKNDDMNNDDDDDDDENENDDVAQQKLNPPPLPPRLDEIQGFYFEFFNYFFF